MVWRSKNYLLRSVMVVLGLVWTDIGMGSEVSVVSGFLRNEKSKFDGKDNGGKSVISIGGRYGEPLSGAIHWYGQGMLAIKSYDAPDGGKAPSDSTSISLLGGVRLYFGDFAANVSPFIGAAGGYVSDKSASPNGKTWQEQERTGLYYYGLAGFRFDCDAQFFIDLEVEIFESALFATTKEKTVGDDDSEAETRHMDLYVDSTGDVGSTTVGLGMHL